MKKLALILAIMLVVPASAFGLEMMNDSAMDEVTGQSGVAIVFDDVEMFMHIDKMAWMDTGGFSSTAYYGGSTSATDKAGALSISNFQLDTLRVNAIVDRDTADGNNALVSAEASQMPLQYGYATGGAREDLPLGGDFGTVSYGLDNYYDADYTGSDLNNFTAKALTIDATSQLPITSEAMSLNNGEDSGTDVGGVLIGLPTVEINIPEIAFTPTFHDIDNDDVTSHNDGEDYGTIYIEGITMTVLNGWMEISPINH